MIATESCWERGCACHDSRESPGVELVKKREWVGLTDEDFLEACQIAERGNYLRAFQRIQIKLKELNA